jgi:hypothetical protein
VGINIIRKKKKEQKMKIKITTENKEKIEKAIDEIAGRLECSYDYNGIEKDIEKIEGRLNILPKAIKSGAVAHLNAFEGRLANSYKYKKEYVYIQAVRGGKDWFITVIRRDFAYPGSNVQNTLVLSDDQEKYASGKLLAEHLKL